MGGQRLQGEKQHMQAQLLWAGADGWDGIGGRSQITCFTHACEADASGGESLPSRRELERNAHVMNSLHSRVGVWGSQGRNEDGGPHTAETLLMLTAGYEWTIQMAQSEMGQPWFLIAALSLPGQCTICAELTPPLQT